MAIVELGTFDISTASPANFATGGFWANLPKLCVGQPVAKLLMISDTLHPADILAGFRRVATPERFLPATVRGYRAQYEDYLERVATDVRYMRTFLIINTRMDDDGLVQTLASYNIAAWPLQEAIPLPFARGEDKWNYVLCEDGMRYAMLRSRERQSGVFYARSLHRLFALEFPIWAALNLYTYSAQEAEDTLRRKRVAARYSRGDSEQAQEAREVMDTVDGIRYQMNRYGAALQVARLYILVGGESGHELNTRLNVVSGALPVAMEPALAKEMPKVFSAQPIVSTEGAVLTTPGVSLLAGSALSYKRRTETGGVLFGVDQNQSLVILNIFDSRNPAYNVNILGQTGSGKTFATLLAAMRHLLLGCRLIIVDPQGNIDLAFLGSEWYHKAVLGTAGASINILDITRVELADQVASVKNTLSMLHVLPPGFPLGNAVLDEALNAIYARIWGKPDEKAQPLGNLQLEVQRVADNAQLPAVKEAANMLAALMDPYTKGTLRHLFGRETTVDFSLSRPVTVYDVSRLPDPTMGGNLRTALLAILVGDVNAGIRRLRDEEKRAGATPVPIIFFVDEMGILMRDAVVAAYVSAEYKTARARRVAMVVADQDLHSMLGPRDEHGVHHGIPILANSAFSFIFHQKGDQKPAIREHFPDIPAEMVERMPQLRTGTCVAMLPDDLLVVNVLPSALDKVILSSRAEDRLPAQEIMKRLAAEAGMRI
jgi:hypothetical protein